MTCMQCEAIEQRGRFCVGCGKRLPPSPLPMRRARLAPQHLSDDDTQPVLRFGVRPRTPFERQGSALVRAVSRGDGPHC